VVELSYPLYVKLLLKTEIAVRKARPQLMAEVENLCELVKAGYRLTIGMDHGCELTEAN
jgi:hypothetical protein